MEDAEFKKLLQWLLPLLGMVLVLFVLIKSCSGDSKPEVPTCDKGDAWWIAEGAVKNVLKNPDEAKFHNGPRWKVDPDPTVAGQYIVTGEVTATNSFNAKLKQTFTAVVRCENGIWYTGNVSLQ